MVLAMPLPPTPRRPVLKAVAGGALALGATAAATGSASAATTTGPRRPGSLPAGAALALRPHGDSDVHALDVPLAEDLLPRVAARRWASSELPTTTHSMVAFTWRRTVSEPRISISSRSGGSWTAWRTLPHLHDLPDAGSPEAGAAQGTELLWVGASDGIRVRVDGARPEGLTLVLLHPASRPGDTTVRPDDAEEVALDRVGTTLGAVTATARGPVAAPRPQIYSRQAWGADESWRNGGPWYNATLVQVHVHHTVNSNGYSRAEVPALMLGDLPIPHRHLGGPTRLQLPGRPLRPDLDRPRTVGRSLRPWGAHPGLQRDVRRHLGHRQLRAGEPIGDSADAIARVAAWKLLRYRRDPTGPHRTSVPRQRQVLARTRGPPPVLDGHRDTNDTACPGDHLYDRLPELRTRAAAVIERAQQATVQVAAPSTLDGPAVIGTALHVVPGTLTPGGTTTTYAWLRDGTVLSGATGVPPHPHRTRRWRPARACS